MIGDDTMSDHLYCIINSIPPIFSSPVAVSVSEAAVPAVVGGRVALPPG